MTMRPVHLGPLSRLAASYLDATNAWSDRIIEAEGERRQAENDVVAAMIAIKRARNERRPFTGLEEQLLRRAEDHVRRGADETWWRLVRSCLNACPTNSGSEEPVGVSRGRPWGAR
jgi:hypothetical protein